MRLKLLYFTADWCRQRQVFSECETEFELVNVDIEVDTGPTRLYRVHSVPTLILVDENDVELGRLRGRPTAASIDRFIGRTSPVGSCSTA